MERFAQIIDVLCAALIAQVAPRSWFGMLFGGVSRSRVMRFCDEMRALSAVFQSIAAEIAADPSVIPPSCEGNATLPGETGTDCPPTPPSAQDMLATVDPVIAVRRTECGVSGETPHSLSACDLPRHAARTTHHPSFASPRDRMVAAYWTNTPWSPSGFLGDPVGGAFPRVGAYASLLAHFVTIT